MNLLGEIVMHLDTGLDSPDEGLDVLVGHEVVGIAGDESLFGDADGTPVRGLLSSHIGNPDNLGVVTNCVGECHSLFSILLLDADRDVGVQEVDTVGSADTGNRFEFEGHVHGSITF